LIIKRIRKTEGFTLSELLIVVAIIGLLVAIGIPGLSKQLERSREFADAANIHSACDSLFEAWLVDNAEHEQYVKIQQKEKTWTYADTAGSFGTLPELTDAEIAAGKVRVIIDKDGKFAIKEK